MINSKFFKDPLLEKHNCFCVLCSRSRKISQHFRTAVSRFPLSSQERVNIGRDTERKPFPKLHSLWREPLFGISHFRQRVFVFLPSGREGENAIENRLGFPVLINSFPIREEKKLAHLKITSQGYLFCREFLVFLFVCLDLVPQRFQLLVETLTLLDLIMREN